MLLQIEQIENNIFRKQKEKYNILREYINLKIIFSI